MPRTRITLVVLCFFFFLPVLARAQTTSIAGTVTDSSGALVPNAKVTADNIATGDQRTAETDESGTYRIPSLTPGTYDVLIERAGFAPVLYSHVDLDVDQVLTLDAKLALQATTVRVLVSGEDVAPIDLNDAQLGNLVSNRQMSDLPLILRDPYQLVLLSPGVVQSNTLLGGLAVNGSRERNNNFLLDGTDNNDAEIPGFSVPQAGLTSLNPDAVQEFRVITSNYNPEFGRNTGAVVDIITKGGTNEYHGDVYWFGRYSALGARDFFNHTVNPVSGKVEPQNSYVRNTFGGSAGGPIQRKNTFWFVNYEGQRFVTTLTNVSTVPTAAFKTGQFTITRDAQGTPLLQAAPVDVRPQTCPNNNIFCLPLDGIMQQILALYPAPNGPSVDDVRGLYYFPSKSNASGDNVTVRLDHKFVSSQAITVRYTFNRYADNNIRHTDFLSGLGSTQTEQRRQNVSLQLTSLLHQKVTNELRLGANRINFPLTCQGLSTLNSFSPPDPFGRGQDFLLPGTMNAGLSTASGSGFGCMILADSSGSKRFSGTYTAGDSLFWVKGRHTVKIGAEYRDIYSNGFNDYASRATLNFANFTTSGGTLPAFMTGNPAVDSNPTLQDMVWSLFGIVGQEAQTQFFDKAGNRTADDSRGFRQKELDAFAQDSYKIASNWTATFGFRYQFNGVPYEAHNLLSTLLVDPSGPAPFTFTTAGHGKGMPSLYNNDWKDIEPRVGLAWDPFKTGKTSLRGGYGVFHDRVFGQLLSIARGNPPFQQIFFQSFITPTSIGAPVEALPAPSQQAFTPVVNDGAGILPFLIDRNLRMPYSQGWNVSIQHEPVATLLIELSYVGSKGTHLLRTVDGNPPQPVLVARLAAFCVPTNPANQGFRTQDGQCHQSDLQFTNLWFGAESGILPFDAANNNAFFQAEVYKSIASSTYHALQANVTKRFSRGFSIQGAYTWSHSIDDASDPLVPGAGNESFPRNSLDLRAERGNSDFDVPQRLALNYIWELPFGKGHRRLSAGGVGKVLEGWKVAGVTTLSSGLPYDIFTGLDTAHTNMKARPDYNPSGTPLPVINPGTQTGPNLGLFSDAPWGRGGNLGRNHFRGPGIHTWDMMLQKSTHIRERVTVDLRAEAYNFFNRTQFNQPGNSTTNPGTFGQSTSELVRPDGTSFARQVQFDMKLRF